MITVDFDFNKISAELDRITAAANSAVRPAAQAAAQVFYDEARARVPVSDAPHIFHGTHNRYLFRSGTLRDAIFQFHKDSTAAHATYIVSWNHRKAPYGYMVEYGTSRAPAHPFLRPAYDAAKERAATFAQSRMAAAVKEALLR